MGNLERKLYSVDSAILWIPLGKNRIEVRSGVKINGMLMAMWAVLKHGMTAHSTRWAREYGTGYTTSHACGLKSCFGRPQLLLEAATPVQLLPRVRRIMHEAIAFHLELLVVAETIPQHYASPSLCHKLRWMDSRV
jgi:hypothetical protein